MVDVDALCAAVDARLAASDAALAARYPGPRQRRQPVHTVYVPADRFDIDTPARWGRAALELLDEHGDLFGELVGSDDVATRVRAKLDREPVEDLRIDFEDGYGSPGDAAEDADVRRTAAAVLEARDGSATTSYGIRIKSLEASTRQRGLRTLAGFLTVLAAEPESVTNFVVTLPKVTSVEQIEAMVEVCMRLESVLGLPARVLRFEIQVEAPQAVLGPDGTALVARMLRAADQRCTGLHFGTYDYTAYCGIAAAYQSLAHPTADHAKLVMQAAAAGTGVWLSDGSTNLLPVGDRTAVRAGWELHLRLVRRALERGYYQGWDLHPAQLPSRYAATFAFYLASLDVAADRLRRYRTHVPGAVADEPATARALADFLLRAVECGAATADEVCARTGVTEAALTDIARPTR